MKTIGALSLISLVLLAPVGTAHASGYEANVQHEGSKAEARVLPAELDPHIPLICLEPFAVPATAVWDFRRNADVHEPECRPIDRDVRQ